MPRRHDAAAAPRRSPQVVTYNGQIDKFGPDQKLTKEDVVDGASFWIEGPQQDDLHANLTNFVRDLRSRLGPGRPLFTGGYTTHSAVPASVPNRRPRAARGRARRPQARRAG